LSSSSEVTDANLAELRPFQINCEYLTAIWRCFARRITASCCGHGFKPKELASSTFVVVAKHLRLTGRTTSDTPTAKNVATKRYQATTIICGMKIVRRLLAVNGFAKPAAG
jgi:hypothetical protein